MSSSEGIIRTYRETETDMKIAMAKSRVLHRGEGGAEIVESLALVDCEDVYRTYSGALANYEVFVASQNELVVDAHVAAAEYHRQLAKPFKPEQLYPAAQDKPKELDG